MLDSPAPAVPDVPLGGGTTIPQVGFGVFQVAGDDTFAAVTAALEAGYRSIDTAAIYFNESEVGQAVHDSGIPRQDLRITTKVWNTDQGYESTLAAFDASLERLGMDYVDLYLIHWPCPARNQYLETWQALEKLLADGRTRAIGVSNFTVSTLERLLASTDVVPAVNQIELHPRLQQAELRDFHARHGIATEAWSPLARGGSLLDDPSITSLADRHGVTPAQVILRWHIQLGNIVIPRSTNPGRAAKNIDLFGFALDPEDMDLIATLDDGGRIGPDPETYDP
jgi:2,5-diketo-D-gluconate reductase A